MHKLVIRTGLFLVTLLLLSGGAGAEEEEAAFTRSGIKEKKTMTRTEDFVVVHGRKLKNNLYKTIRNMSLFSSIGGRARPIPFQIDELNPEGEWVLTKIPLHLQGTSIEPEKDDDNGHLDKNDELVFMVRDSGDRIPKEQYPQGALAVDEITLADPIDGNKSWVYLCSFLENPPRSDKDYVDYVFPKDQMDYVISGNYKIGYTPELPNSPSYISIGGSKNILDRMKIRFTVKILGIPFDFNEDLFWSRLSLYNDGPIRVIRRTRNAIQLTKTFRSSSAAIENVMYDNASVVPFRIKLPVSLKWLKRIFNMTGRSGADFQNMHGWQVKTNVDPRWLNVDGKMDEIEKEIGGENFNWFVVKGPEGAFMIRAIFNRKPDGSFQDTPLSSSLYYLDDDTALDPPESVPGQSPHIGYWMNGMNELPRGTFYIYPIMYLIKNYKEGAENDFIKILDQQIRVMVD
ncbi:MAG: hypothetical protein JSU92_14955 [Deltaproteobacteria bacterium]|nr:MAG: hypothetical protein JSU92_14955 [Deltaproteobacteria bacterium]